MSNQPNASAQSEAQPTRRVFQIGANRIAEDSTTAQLNSEQIRQLLKSQYPEIANATIRETVSGDIRTISFTPVPGRKG